MIYKGSIFLLSIFRADWVARVRQDSSFQGKKRENFSPTITWTNEFQAGNFVSAWMVHGFTPEHLVDRGTHDTKVACRHQNN